MDITSYDILLILAILTALILFSILSKSLKMDLRIRNFIFYIFPIVFLFGFLSSWIFQGFYDYLKSGVVRLDENTGITFYGGLIGGLLTFILIYFTTVHFLFKDKIYLTEFNKLINIIFTIIPISHAIGRIGCFINGCCYGKETTSFIGIYHDGIKLIPTQLIEALFLFILFLISLKLLFKKKNILPIYLISYGLFRFIIEYFRGDERGASIVDFLSPSQFISLILIIVGIIFVFIYKHKKRRS